MSRYIIQLSIGPVQDFIAAARRTRDLWFGSNLLSEISKAAAKSILDSGGALIFPYSDKLDADLEPLSPFNVANVILAEVEAYDETLVKDIAQKAKEAANARWQTFADEALEILRGRVDEQRWNSQQEQEKMRLIEFYYAWYPFIDDSGYGQARQQAARIISARKNLRDFAPWHGASGVPKSSLDGRRESVLKKIEKNASDTNARGVRIKSGEALDIVGCVKRAAGGKETFPSVINVALDPWVRGIESQGGEAAEKLNELCSCCEKLAALDAISRHQSGLPSELRFPYSGSALLPSRYSEIEEEASDKDKAAAKSVTREMKKIMQRIHELHKPMDPYLAVLVADGDRMGKTISEMKSPDEHREFSKTLSRFAKKAREIVKKNFGCCVYTGGDDVLAFLPLDKALPCAKELHDVFGSLWETKQDGNSTLSVGLSIAHAFEDLEDLLNFGREAEKSAKKGTEGKTDDDRNGLSVTIRARSNSSFVIRERWDCNDVNTGKNAGENSLAKLSLDKRLLFWIECFKKERIPSKFPYELLKNAEFYKDWERGDDRSEAVQPKVLNEAMKSDVMRILNRKELKLGNDKERVKEYVESVIEGSHESIQRFAHELMAAQWFKAGYAAAGGEVNV